MNHSKELEELGLTRGESKVYLSLLHAGPSTVGPIVNRSGVAYSNIYEILNRLMEKGLVSFIVKEKTKVFQANEPGRIADYLQERKEEAESRIGMLDRMLPDLKRIGQQTGREAAEIFIGTKGLRTAFERMLSGARKVDEGLFFYVHEDKYYAAAERFYMKTWPQIQKYGNRWRGISEKGLKGTRLAASYPKFIRQRYVRFPVPGNIDILGRHVLITVWGESPVGILVDSEELSGSFRKYFESVWKAAE